MDQIKEDPLVYPLEHSNTRASFLARNLALTQKNPDSTKYKPVSSKQSTNRTAVVQLIKQMLEQICQDLSHNPEQIKVYANTIQQTCHEYGIQTFSLQAFKHINSVQQFLPILKSLVHSEQYLNFELAIALIEAVAQHQALQRPI